MRKGVKAVFILWAVLTAAGCKKSPSKDTGPQPPPPPPLLGEVSVSELVGNPGRPEGVKIATDSLTNDVRDRLGKAAIFAGVAGLESGDAARSRFRVEFVLEEVPAGERAAARAVIRLRVDGRPSSAVHPRWNEDTQAGAETTFTLTPPPDRQAIFDKLARRAVLDVVNAYIERQKLWSGTQDEVHAALGVGEPEIQLEAIRIIRERRFKSEAPTLLELLNHENERLRDAALGALVDFREQKAVAVLARQRSMRDRREMRKIIEAISVLGGEEARDYLGFVAETHDDAEIKEMAQKARERLNRRAENPAQR